MDIALRTAGATAPDWNALAADGSMAVVGGAWLDRLRADQPQVVRGLILARSEAHELRLAVVRPVNTPVDDLQELLTTASRSTQGECLDIPAGGVLLTAPLVWKGALLGLVALQLPDRKALETARHWLAWGSGWLVATLARVSMDAERHALLDARRLLDLVTTTLSEPDFDAATLAVANGLAAAWQADGVTLGWVEQRRTRVVARANASDSDERANLLGMTAAAMDEALDLRQSVQWQAAPGAQPVPTHVTNLPEHRTLAREARADNIVTALLFDRGVAIGAVLLERRTPLTADEMERLDTQCMMLAPLLAQQRSASRGLAEHARASTRTTLQRLFDDSNLGWKLGMGAVALLLVVAALVPVPFRITSPALVEGEVQRSVVAPFQGFIREASVRAGDVVRSGQVMAMLEDKDLQLDRARWEADLEVALRKEREALAVANRVDLRLAGAQANQARAQLDLVLEKLKRVQVTAPFDGVVVHGDLSQQLGSPIEQGKVLFELAPLDAWRVILKVDERDIAQVASAQTGELVLTGLAGVHQRFTVKRVTAVAVAEEGRNHFRVEADLQDPTRNLRPGMEGVAKIEAGRGSALWVWTRRLADWVRLTVWEWSP
ncbi:hypothetical protein BH11PSE8_BH11PSE8_37810 [soil metagenome]